MYFYITTFFLLFALFLSGCRKPGAACLGTWCNYTKLKYASDRCEFLPDGTLLIESGSERVQGTWSVLPDGRIRMGARSAVGLASITGDEMVIELAPQEQVTYVREGTPRAAGIQASVTRAAAELKQRAEAEAAAEEARRAAQAAADAQRQAAANAERESVEASRRLRAGKLQEAQALVELAWRLATSRDKSKLNGKKAVELARRAVEVDPDNAAWQDVLGAAYARNGQFDLAIAAAKQAVSLKDHIEYARRLVQYEQGEPYEGY